MTTTAPTASQIAGKPESEPESDRGAESAAGATTDVGSPATVNAKVPVKGCPSADVTRQSTV